LSAPALATASGGSYPAVRRSARRRTNSLAAGFAVALFLLLLRNLIVSGYVNDPAVNLQVSEGSWQSGVWMSEIVLFLLRFLPAGNIQELALNCFAPLVAGALIGLLYHNLRDSNWPRYAALAVIAAVAAHPLTLYTITAASLPSPILVAFAAIIPVIRRLEAIGDVQAEVTLGLALPLLLLAGPETAPLIVPLALLSVFWNPDARREFRAFLAMFIVALLPTMMVALGVLGFALHNHIEIGAALAPYAAAFSHFEPGRWADGLLPLALMSPIALVPAIHCLVPDRRRKMWSALCVIAFPLYLAIGREVFVWSMPDWVPAVALIACFAAWAAVVRLHRPMRYATLALLALTVVIAWQSIGFPGAAAWTQGLAGGPETAWLLSTAEEALAALGGTARGPAG